MRRIHAERWQVNFTVALVNNIRYSTGQKESGGGNEQKCKHITDW